MSVIRIPSLIRGRHIWDRFRMPAGEFTSHRDKMCDFLIEKGLDGVICYADSICNGYVEYFTNYNCVITSTNAIFILLADGTNRLIASVPGRDLERIKSTFIPPEIDVELAGMESAGNDHLGEKVAGYLTANGLAEMKWAGINLSRCMRRIFSDIKRTVPDIMDITREFEVMRSIKTPAEISIISQASSLARLAAIELARACVPDSDELIAVTDADRLIRCDGAEDVQLLIGTSGSGGFLRLPTSRRIVSGEYIKILAQVQYLRYKGEYGLTVIAGGMHDEGAMRVGRSTAVFNQLCDAIVVGAEFPAGWKESFAIEPLTHTAIHGIGQDLFEMPYASAPSVRVEENMTLGLVVESNADCTLFADTLLCKKNGAISMSGQVSGF